MLLLMLLTPSPVPNAGLALRPTALDWHRNLRPVVASSTAPDEAIDFEISFYHN